MRTLLLLVLGTLSIAVHARPVVLIVQQYAPESDGMDPNVQIAKPLAQLLVEDSRVQPVIWSESDPIFLKWVESGFAPKGIQTPNESEMRKAVNAANADYLMVISGLKIAGEAVGACNLFRKDSTKATWVNTQRLKCTVNGLPDWVSGGMSVANTWVNLLIQGPFKNIAKSEPPMADQPNLPTVPRPEVPDPPAETRTVDPARVIQEADAFLRQGMPLEAALRLRQGVDELPEDTGLRIRLVTALLQINEPGLAEQEAQRFADLGAQDPAMLGTSARLWLMVGKATPAQGALNELKARVGDNEETQLLQGMVDAVADRLSAATDSFRASLEKKPTYEGWGGLAYCEAWQGHSDQVLAALEGMRLSKSIDPLVYGWLMRLCSSRWDLFAAQFRDASRLVQSDPNSPDSISRAAKIKSIAESVSAFIDGMLPPTIHNGSHQQRRLMGALLLQAAGECFEAAQKGDADLAAESELTLSEALKQNQLIVAEYQRELTGK
ncbi:MAG: hypothetical protein JST40_10095 [Armatimonadetes bacterium]|nr:hypothetical protein [Armatimonadota bacterium]